MLSCHDIIQDDDQRFALISEIVNTFDHDVHDGSRVVGGR